VAAIDVDGPRYYECSLRWLRGGSPFSHLLVSTPAWWWAALASGRSGGRLSAGTAVPFRSATL